MSSLLDDPVLQLLCERYGLSPHDVLRHAEKKYPASVAKWRGVLLLERQAQQEVERAAASAERLAADMKHRVEEGPPNLERLLDLAGRPPAPRGPRLVPDD